MKLKTYPPITKSQIGDRKKEKQFAWIPKRVEDKLIWLESYFKVYEFQKKDYIDPTFLIRIPNVECWVFIKSELKK